MHNFHRVFASAGISCRGIYFGGIMKVRDCMSHGIIAIMQDEPVSAAARLMKRHNVGMLPVRNERGALLGTVTDRDIVTRCVANDESPEKMTVRQIMSNRVISVTPLTDLMRACNTMKREQLRRLPVVDNGRLCGILTLADVIRSGDYMMEAAECMEEIFNNLHHYEQEK